MRLLTRAISIEPPAPAHTNLVLPHRRVLSQRSSSMPKMIRSCDLREKLPFPRHRVKKKCPKSCNALARLKFNFKKLMLHLPIRIFQM